MGNIIPLAVLRPEQLRDRGDVGDFLVGDGMAAACAALAHAAGIFESPSERRVLPDARFAALQLLRDVENLTAAFASGEELETAVAKSSDDGSPETRRARLLARVFATEGWDPRDSMRRALVEYFGPEGALSEAAE